MLETGGGGGRRWLPGFAVLVAAVLLSGCVGPSRTHSDYTEKAANTAEAARSAVETSRLVVEAAERGSAYGPYTGRTLSDMEGSLGSIATGFASVQPPGTKADRLRRELVALLDEARSTVSRLRIAARRGDRRTLSETARALPRLSRRLAAYERLTPT